MPAVLWIGNADLPEFAPTAVVLRERLGMTVARDAAAARRGEAGDDWLLAVVAEAFPGEHDRDELDALRRRRPTLPIVRLVGPGCDGELRSYPPPAAHRYGWLEAPRRLADDCDRLERGACPTWGTPVTAGAEEPLIDAPGADEGASQIAGLCIGIVADRPEIRAWLDDLVRRRAAVGIRINLTAPPEDEVDVVLWHLPLREEAFDVALQRVPAVRSRAGVVALMSFSRPAWTIRLRDAGITAMVALPAGPQAIEATIAGASAMHGASRGD